MKIRRVKIADPLTFWLAAAATIFGLFAIFDAGYPRAIASGSVIPGELKTQMVAIVLAVVAFWGANLVKPKAWRTISIIVFAIAFVMLFLPFVPGLGSSSGGAHRWFKLPLLPQIQPAEFMKFAAILFLAGSFADRKPFVKRPAKDWAQDLDRNMVPRLGRWMPGILVMLAAFLIEREPDLGTAGVVVASAFAIAFVGRASKWTLAVATLMLVGGVFLVAKAQPYRMARIHAHDMRWQSQNVDDIAYQSIQGEVATAEGGIAGTGIGSGRVKHVMPAATTDFIFATISEEFGFLGSGLVVLLLAALTMRLLALARLAKTQFASLMLVGLASWIGIQTVVNILMANAAIMAIGIPLPFISCGGSSLTALWLALGVCNVALLPEPAKEAVANANRRNRWGDRRSRLSRA